MGLDNPIHIAFLLILLLLVFGAKRLPEMGKSLGSGMRGFKDAISGESAEAAASTPSAVLAVQGPATVPAPAVHASAPVPAGTAPAAAVNAAGVDAPTAHQPVAEKLTA